MAHNVGGSLNDLMASHPYGCGAQLHQSASSGHPSYLTSSGYCNGASTGATPADLSSFYADSIQAVRTQNAMAASANPWYAGNTESRLASKISTDTFFSE